jgi:hypothetical protein
MAATQREIFLVRSLYVRRSTNTGFLKVVRGQHAVCQRYGSLNDRSQQQQQQLQHADSHIGSCHLQRKVHGHVHDLSIHLTPNLNKALILKIKLLFIRR